MKLTMNEQLMQLKQSMELNNNRNETNDPKQETEDRNTILKHLLALEVLFEDLRQIDKEGDRRNGGCDQVADRFGKENAKGLVGEEDRQDKDQRDQKDDLSQQRKEEADLCLSQRHKALLAAHL